MSTLETLLRSPLPTLPIPLPYAFRSSLLFRQVLTHTSCGLFSSPSPTWSSVSPSPTIRRDNEHLEFLGDAVAKSLTAHLLDLLWPNLSEARLSELTVLLVNNHFYAYLSQRLGLAEKVIAVSPEAKRSARVSAGVFEAYIGGMHRELGLAGHEKLFQWFRALIEGYARHFHAQLGCGVSDSRREKDEWEQKEEGKTWAAWLHEFAGKQGLQMPEYVYRVKGGKPHLPVWECTVVLSGQKHGVAEGSGKKEAREKACERTWSGLHTRRAPSGALGRDI